MSDETTPEPQVLHDPKPLVYAIRLLAFQNDRLLSALRKLVNEPQDITSKAYQHALGVLGEFEG